MDLYLDDFQLYCIKTLNDGEPAFDIIDRGQLSVPELDRVQCTITGKEEDAFARLNLRNKRIGHLPNTYFSDFVHLTEFECVGIKLDNKDVI